MIDLIELVSRHPAFLDGSQETFKQLVYECLNETAKFVYMSSNNKEAIKGLMLRAIEDAVTSKEHECKAALQKEKKDG